MAIYALVFFLLDGFSWPNKCAIELKVFSIPLVGDSVFFYRWFGFMTTIEWLVRSDCDGSDEGVKIHRSQSGPSPNTQSTNQLIECDRWSFSFIGHCEIVLRAKLNRSQIARTHLGIRASKVHLSRNTLCTERMHADELMRNGLKLQISYENRLFIFFLFVRLFFFRPSAHFVFIKEFFRLWVRGAHTVCCVRCGAMLHILATPVSRPFSVILCHCACFLPLLLSVSLLRGGMHGVPFIDCIVRLSAAAVQTDYFVLSSSLLLLLWLIVSFSNYITTHPVAHY